MSRTPHRPEDEREENLPGLPPAKDRQRPGALDKARTAWTRGDGGMEGPSGWHSAFGRAGFASTGERLNDPAKPINPLEKTDQPGPTTSSRRDDRAVAAKPESRPVDQGDPTDPWDKPYGDASWGGQATRTTTPEEDKASKEPGRVVDPRRRR